MQYFDLGDIVKHLASEFPELTQGTLKRIARASLREIGKRAALGRPVSINGRMIASGNELDFYALYMPAPPEKKFGKIYKLDHKNVKSKRK
jgi:hypothetical protein